MDTDKNPRAGHQPSADERIGRNANALMWWHKDKQTVIAKEMGIDQSSLSLKLRGFRPWNADEVDFIASRYGVAHGVLFAKELPHLDSNEEPIGSPLRPITYVDFPAKKILTHTSTVPYTMTPEGESA